MQTVRIKYANFFGKMNVIPTKNLFFRKCITLIAQKKKKKSVLESVPYFLLFQKASTKILLYLIATGQTEHPSSKAP